MREQVRLLAGNLDCLNVTTYALSHHNLIISTRTFTSLDNHKRAAEVIFFCLFNLYDSIACQTRLSPHYPCTSGLVSKEFRNAVYEWLVELKRSPPFATSLIRRSMLDDCAGERYEDLLYHFSSYLFREQIRALPKDKVDNSVHCALDSSSSLEALMVHDIIQSHRLTGLHTRKGVALTLYKSFADKLRGFEANKSPAGGTEQPVLDSSTNLVQPLSRIRHVLTSTRVMELLTPASPKVEPFLDQLPWEPTMFDKERHPNYRDQLEQDILASKQQIERQIALIDSLPEQQKPMQQERPLSLTLSKNSKDMRVDIKLQFAVNFQRDLARDIDQIEHEISRSLADQRSTSFDRMPDITAIQVDSPAVQQILTETGSSAHNQGHVLPRSDFVRRVKNCGDEPPPTYELPPETPVRARKEEPTATAKSVRRLMDLLNDSQDPSMSTTPTYERNTRQGGTDSLPARRLEATFRLWDQ